MEQKDRRLHRLRWRLFAVSAALAVVGIAGFVAAVSVWNGPGSLGRWVDNPGQLAAAALAAAACSWAARRSSGRERLGWALLAASAASWAAGQTVWSAYALLLGVAIPYPSSGDIGFLAAIAFAFAGILCFWSPARGTAVRWRVWLDGAII